MMIYVLLKYKEFYSNIGLQYDELDLSHCWQFMEEYREAFYPLYLASLISQQEECPISQFHLEWLKAYGQVKALKSNRFRDNILLSMDKRQKTLMEPIAYRAALYMDPRFMYSGSELFKREEKAEIVKYLVKLWNNINVNRPETSTVDDNQDTAVSNNSFDINDYFTQLFGEGTSTRSSKPTSLEEKLLQIQCQDRVNPAEQFNIIHYWYAQRVHEERLWKLAKVVYAAASTQAAVERDFSAYNRIFTNLRNRLAGDTIEHVLKVKLNKDLIEPTIREIIQSQPAN
nr:uncharacterized protein LOC115270908 [Aedes albopictus]